MVQAARAATRSVPLALMLALLGTAPERCGSGSAAGLRGSLAGPGMLPGHGKSGPSRELDHLECRKCGEDLFDFSRSASEPAAAGAPKKPFGLLRPAGLGQKALPPPPGRGGRHSAPVAPIVGGDEIALDSGVTTGPSDPAEPGYAGPHKKPTQQTILGRKMNVHHLKNPHGREFEVVTVTNLTNYKTHGGRVAEHSWFPGYSWQIIVCAHCGHHIGWRFDRLEPSRYDYPTSAFLSPTNLPVHNCEVRVGGSGKEAAAAAASGAGQRGAEQQPAEFFFGILPSEALIESTALKSKLVTHGDL